MALSSVTRGRGWAAVGSVMTKRAPALAGVTGRLLTFMLPVETQRAGLPSRPFSTVKQVELSIRTVPKA